MFGKLCRVSGETATNDNGFFKEKMLRTAGKLAEGIVIAQEGAEEQFEHTKDEYSILNMPPAEAGMRTDGQEGGGTVSETAHFF